MKYVVLAVLLVLLVGCGRDPQPHFTSPPPPTVSPTATAPAVETPEAFLRRWYRVSDGMELTGKTKAFDSMHLKSCRSCETYESAIRGFYFSGQRVVGTHTSVRSVRRLRADVWIVDSAAAEVRIIDRRGRIVGRYPGGLETYRITLAKRADGWRIASMIRLAAAA